MHKLIAAIAALIASVSIAYAATQVMYDNNYARDRAEIEDLQARYMFALDWQDADLYASTFTKDGVLDWAGGVVKGRDAIRKEVQGMKATFDKRAASEAPERPSRLRHFISNIVIKVHGDTATGRAYWFEFDDNIRDRRPYLGAYGHYDDEMRKVDGHWLFTRRRINNEMMDSRAAGNTNPAW